MARRASRHRIIPMTPTHSAVAIVALRAPLALVEAPTITPGPGEVRVHCLWTASTPMDLHRNDGGLLVTHPQILGAGVAGRVVEVGQGVADIHVGDRVFGFAWRNNTERAHQDFITTSAYLLGKVPDNLSYEAAVTVPNSFVTTWHTFITDLSIPLPFPKPASYTPLSADLPILIWGGATSVGQFAIELLKYYGYNNVITTASRRHHDYLASLGAASIFDYNGPDVVEQISAAVGDRATQTLILDCVGSAKGSITPVSKIARNGDIVAILLPVIIKEASSKDTPEYSFNVEQAASWEEGVIVRGVRAHFYLNNEFNKENLQPIIIPELLAQNIIRPNRYRIIEGNSMLERAQNALDALRRKEVRGERLVWRVSDLPEVA